MKSAVPQDKYLDVNGLRLHYLDWGNDGYQTMLVLHGFMAHAHVWDDFALNFRSRYHVIALDQRGHGESQWSNEMAYTVEDHFVDIINFVEILGLKNLILIGHSMGGRNALFYAAYNSHNVSRLILVDARPGHSSESSEALRQLLVNLPLQAECLEEIVRVIQGLYPYLSWDVCHHTASHGYRQMPDGKFVPKYDIRMIQPLERSGYVAEEFWVYMENISCPTLIVRGKESPFLSRADAHEMCRVITMAEWVEIPRSTHMPAQENSKAFNRAILRFIGSVHP